MNKFSILWNDLILELSDEEFSKYVILDFFCSTQFLILWWNPFWYSNGSYSPVSTFKNLMGVGLNSISVCHVIEDTKLRAVVTISNVSVEIWICWFRQLSNANGIICSSVATLWRVHNISFVSLVNGLCSETEKCTLASRQSQFIEGMRSKYCLIALNFKFSKLNVVVTRSPSFCFEFWCEYFVFALTMMLTFLFIEMMDEKNLLVERFDKSIKLCTWFWISWVWCHIQRLQYQNKCQCTW